MPHLDNGLLHAYLDGGLSPAGHGTGDAGVGEDNQPSVEQVEKHLRDCADCRAQLEEARWVKDAASGILSASGPAEVAKPSFEELVARAESRKRPGSAVLRDDATVVQKRQLIRMRSLAWAAVVVLAAAVGWYARSVVVMDNRSESIAEENTRGQIVVAVPRTEPAVTARDAADAEVSSFASGTGEPDRATTREAEALREEDFTTDEEAMVVGGVAVTSDIPAAVPPDRDMALDEPAEERERAAKGAEGAPIPIPASDSIARENILVAAETVSAAVSGAVRDLRAAAAPQIQQVAAERAAAEPSVSPEVRLRGVTEVEIWTDADSTTAAATLGIDVPTIAGLRVAGYSTAAIADKRAVLVYQSLESGEVLELLITYEGDIDLFEPKKRLTPADAGAFADAIAVNSVTVQRGGLAVLLSGAIPTDSLRALGERLLFP